MIVRANSNRAGYEWPNEYEVDSSDTLVAAFVADGTFTVLEADTSIDALPDDDVDDIIVASDE